MLQGILSSNMSTILAIADLAVVIIFFCATVRYTNLPKRTSDLNVVRLKQEIAFTAIFMLIIAVIVNLVLALTVPKGDLFFTLLFLASLYFLFTVAYEEIVTKPVSVR